MKASAGFHGNNSVILVEPENNIEMGNMEKILDKVNREGLVFGITREYYPSGGLHYKLSLRQIEILGDKYQLKRMSSDKE